MRGLLLWLVATLLCITLVLLLIGPMAAELPLPARFFGALIVGAIGGLGAVRFFNALVNQLAQRLLTGRG